MRMSGAETVIPARPQLRLLNNTLAIDIAILDGSLLGRTSGNYMAIFGRFGHVSSRHCTFRYDESIGWCVTDVGSTHKTHYNNVPLVPNVPQQLADRSFLKIANIEFFVRIGAV
jgi:predicted component of type VI protein secretion system